MTRDFFKALGVRDPALFVASSWTRLKEARAIGVADKGQGQSAGLIRRPMTRALVLSLLFHMALVAAMIFSVGQKPVLHDRMIRVSLVDDVPPGAAMAGKAGRSVKAVAAVREAPQGTNRGLTRKRQDQMFSSPSVPVPPRQPVPVKEVMSEKPVMSQEPVPEADATPPAPQAPKADLYARGLGNADGMGGGAARGAGYGTGAGMGGAGEGAGSGTGGSGTGSGQAAYLREHFVYIRDLIMKNLKYPATARKLGWKGAVTVSFVVLENGAAQDIKVIKSSGHDILDKAVIRTIQETQPFPKPPVKAELTIPIIFRLEAETG